LQRRKFVEVGDERKKFSSALKAGAKLPMHEYEERPEGSPKKKALHVSYSAYCIAGDDRSFIPGFINLAQRFWKGRRF
jgi:hypothetical protein